jgi:hypothetical protein
MSIIKIDFTKYDVTMWTTFIWLRIGASGGTGEGGNEHYDSIKGGKFLS